MELFDGFVRFESHEASPGRFGWAFIFFRRLEEADGGGCDGFKVADQGGAVRVFLEEDGKARVFGDLAATRLKRSGRRSSNSAAVMLS